MKVSIGMRIQDGPFGGGNRFGELLAEYLVSQGAAVCFDLKDPNIDIILLMEPDGRLKGSAFTHRDVMSYLCFRNRRALVVHRVNNTSEARDDAEKRFNRYRINANRIADHTVFISEWVRKRYVESGFDSKNLSIIMNGGDLRVFSPAEKTAKSRKVRIVTHHWSKNIKKGFDIYQKLDRMIAEKPWSDCAAFTYIGRVPDECRFEHAQVLDPINKGALANELRNQDLYLTASRNESAGMHHIEGALCGLPVLHIESGALAEYCAGYGLSFKENEFEEKLMQMIREIDFWKDRMRFYDRTSDKMCGEYHRLFLSLLEKRSQILTRRRITRWVSMLIRDAGLRTCRAKTGGKRK